METAKKRYACNAYLDEDAYEEVRKIEKDIRDLTGAQQYMTEWKPHITVGSGNELTDSELQSQKTQLAEVAKRHEPFAVHIGPIEYRINEIITRHDPSYLPYHVYLKVEQSEQLKRLVDDVALVLHQYDVFYNILSPYGANTGYWPHVGLASRDLTKKGWEKVQEQFKQKSFDRDVKISHFSLFISPTGVQDLDYSKEIVRFYLGSGKLQTSGLDYPNS